MPTITCSICLDDSEEISTLVPCTHEFCASCITSWAKVSSSCPLCKSNFTSIRLNNELEIGVEEKKLPADYGMEDEVPQGEDFDSDADGSDGSYRPDDDELRGYDNDGFVVPDDEIEMDYFSDGSYQPPESPPEQRPRGGRRRRRLRRLQDNSAAQASGRGRRNRRRQSPARGAPAQPSLGSNRRRLRSQASLWEDDVGNLNDDHDDVVVLDADSDSDFSPPMARGGASPGAIVSPYFQGSSRRQRLRSNAASRPQRRTAPAAAAVNVEEAEGQGGSAIRRSRSAAAREPSNRVREWVDDLISQNLREMEAAPQSPSPIIVEDSPVVDAREASPLFPQMPSVLERIRSLRARLLGPNITPPQQEDSPSTEVAAQKGGDPSGSISCIDLNTSTSSLNTTTEPSSETKPAAAASAAAAPAASLPRAKRSLSDELSASKRQRTNPAIAASLADSPMTVDPPSSSAPASQPSSQDGTASNVAGSIHANGRRKSWKELQGFRSSIVGLPRQRSLGFL